MSELFSKGHQVEVQVQFQGVQRETNAEEKGIVSIMGVIKYIWKLLWKASPVKHWQAVELLNIAVFTLWLKIPLINHGIISWWKHEENKFNY